MLNSTNFADSIIFFLLAGVIPGTNFQLTPEQALGLFAISISLIAVYFRSPISHKNDVNKSDINYSIPTDCAGRQPNATC